MKEYFFQAPLWIFNVTILLATIYLFIAQTYPVKISTPLFLLVIDILYVVGRIIGTTKIKEDKNATIG